MANLVAPERIVLCEGRPPREADNGNSEFDAKCYRRIFASEYPETDFLSVGSSRDVTHDRLDAGKTIQTIATGTILIRVIDRDLRNADEAAAQRARGVRVLNRRNIEAYLLDDEVLAALCREAEQIDRAPEPGPPAGRLDASVRPTRE